MKFEMLRNSWGKFAGLLAAGLCALALSSCGGGGGCSTVDGCGSPGSSTVASIALTSSNGTLASAGTSGTEATITALVRDASNNVVPNTAIAWGANQNGALSSVSTTSDDSGKATAKLGTGGDPTNRTITVTASSGGHTATVAVDVVGTTLSLNAASSVNAGSNIPVTVTLKDSVGNPLSNKTVTFGNANAAQNTLTSGSTTTNSSGQLVLTYTAGASSTGTDTVTVTSLGITQTVAIAINSSSFFVNGVVSSVNSTIQSQSNIGVCQAVRVYGGSGSSAATLTSSRGTVYSDSGCATATTSFTLSSGEIVAYVKSANPGVSTLTATSGSLTALGTLEFVAPLTGTATITLQADPAIVGVNPSGSTANQSTLRAIVHDNTGGNLVKGATVNFTITADASAGSLTSGSAVTGSDGSATVNFIAGSSTTALNGVVITATIVGGSNASTTANLTVSAQTVFISVGTGNTITAVDSTTYSKDYAVFVTDATGNPKAGVNVTAAITPYRYGKGTRAWSTTNSIWVTTRVAECMNEDSNRNATLDPAEDINSDGVLWPGNGAVTASPAGTTDASGRATVTIYYAKDRADWIEADLVIRGSVSGSEATYTARFWLPGLSSDFTVQAVTPPGTPSPYGQAVVCTNPL